MADTNIMKEYFGISSFDVNYLWTGLYDEFINNPINLVLLVIILILLRNLLVSEQTEDEMDQEEDVAPRDFTLEELKPFNGTDSKKIYIAVGGVVFDVSSRPDFYGPGSSYGVFAGGDASRGLATMSLEPREDTTWDDLGDLTAEEHGVLKDWVATFSKYPVRGKLVKSHEESSSDAKCAEPDDS